jgi:hypothetical protein
MYVYLYICINQIYRTKNEREKHEQNVRSCKQRDRIDRDFFKEGYILSF